MQKKRLIVLTEFGRKNDTKRPRPIIVKLTRYNARKKFLQVRES